MLNGLLSDTPFETRTFTSGMFYLLATLFCEQGHSVVIIDNTCIVAWETRKYIEIANETGYIVIMITPNGHFTTPTEVLARRNKHEVPADIIERKRRVGTFYLGVELLLHSM